MKSHARARHSIEIVSIGTELLSGIKTDGDFSLIAQALESVNHRVTYHTTVSDVFSELTTVLQTSLQRSDIIILTGGLGPTSDDITRTVLADLLGIPLVYSRSLEQKIHDQFVLRGIPMPEANKSMAYVIEGAQVLSNDVGNAPGMIVTAEEHVIVVLPGPPAELQPMLLRDVIPFISKKFPQKARHERIVKICGLPESEVQQLITEHRAELEDMTDIAYLASPGDILVKIASYNEKSLSGLSTQLKKIFGKYLYAEKDISLEETIGMLLTQRKKTLALAESCTGGLVASRITDIPGSSEYFLMGVISYTNKSKEEILGVSERTLSRFGAVSAPTVEAMAQGICRISTANIGISLSGIAGPGGGTQEKPIGLVFFGLADEASVFSEKRHFVGDRKKIKRLASQYALDMLRRYLLRIPEKT